MGPGRNAGTYPWRYVVHSFQGRTNHVHEVSVAHDRNNGIDVPVMTERQLNRRSLLFPPLALELGAVQKDNLFNVRVRSCQIRSSLNRVVKISKPVPSQDGILGIKNSAGRRPSRADAVG